MTREEKQQNKQKEKELKELMKNLGRKYGMKNKQNILFYIFNDYFVTILYDFYPPNNNIMYDCGIKYLAYDDIQWDVLDMSNNKKQPQSLRATGAFSALGYGLCARKVISLGDNPESVLNNILSEIKQKVENFNEDLDGAILADLKRDSCTTLEFIVYLHQKEYAKARKLAEECIAGKDTGIFSNKGKTFFELGIEYLNKNNL